MQNTCPRIVPLVYRDTREPGLPPLVLLMGIGASGATWPAVFVDRLNERGLRVIAPDNRDSGGSARMPGDPGVIRIMASIAMYIAGGSVSSGYRLEDMAADVIAMLDRLEIERAHVAGLSMGGMIAQVLACRYPERLKSLTVISSASGNARTGRGTVTAIRIVLRPMRADAPEAVLRSRCRELMETIGGPKFHLSDCEAGRMVADIRNGGLTQAAVGRQTLAILASGDRRRQLKRITVPTLVIHGTADPLLPLAAGREIAECIPGSRLVEMPGMGHVMPEEYLPEVADIIADHCLKHDSQR